MAIVAVLEEALCVVELAFLGFLFVCSLIRETGIPGFHSSCICLMSVCARHLFVFKVQYALGEHSFWKLGYRAVWHLLRGLSLVGSLSLVQLSLFCPLRATD